MPAGNFDTRVQIQRSTASRDAHGAVTYTWATVARRWADVEQVGGSSIYSADKINADANVRVILRDSVDGIDAGYRIVTPSSTLNVEKIVTPRRNAYGRAQECACKEVIN